MIKIFTRAKENLLPYPPVTSITFNEVSFPQYVCSLLVCDSTTSQLTPNRSSSTLGELEVFVALGAYKSN